MNCAHCLEEIHPYDRQAPNDKPGFYHVKFWVQITADHEAEPVSEVVL